MVTEKSHFAFSSNVLLKTNNTLVTGIEEHPMNFKPIEVQSIIDTIVLVFMETNVG
jgi:hypothetical protein